ncbi:MAG: Mur ligase family protein [Candidatus Doudnabacteria bacterium]
MKHKIKQIVQNQLARLASQLVSKHHPIVIGITGSIGKTSTRDAVFAVVNKHFSTRKPYKNLNNEFGMPLSIIGATPPTQNPLSWIKAFLYGYWQLFFGYRFPEVLILEMGVDKPGDMDYLLSIAKPNIAILTFIGQSHLENFGSQEALIKEKSKLIQAVPSDGYAIVNADSELAIKQIAVSPGQVLTYSTSPKTHSTVCVQLEKENFEIPVSSDIKVSSSLGEFTLSLRALGQGHLSAIAAAVTLGQILDLTLPQIVTGLAEYKPVAGRLNFIRGIKKTLLLEDSYNAAPDSMLAALDLLGRVDREKRSQY